MKIIRIPEDAGVTEVRVIHCRSWIGAAHARLRRADHDPPWPGDHDRLAHAPLWEPAHERAPSKENAANYTNLNSSEGVFAMPLLEGEQSNVRMIRLAPGRSLPPHRHNVSDLMLYVVAGDGQLDQPGGAVPFSAGALAFYAGSEELRVRNTGSVDMTMLAFLAPKFAT